MKVYQTDNGPCPYLPNGEWKTDVLYAIRITPGSYEKLLENGWRRSGCCFYLNTCEGCSSCIPLRIDVNRFCTNRSQQRTHKRNHAIRVERIPVVFDTRDYELYKKYCLSRHNQSPSEEEYSRFLIQSPLTTEIMRYWNASQLIATAWIDMLPNSISSVYCAYDPECIQRSPGTLSILRQIELCRELEKSWLYLGFYVPASERMNYKKTFQPCEVLVDRKWRSPEN